MEPFFLKIKYASAMVSAPLGMIIMLVWLIKLGTRIKRMLIKSKGTIASLMFFLKYW